MTYMEERFRGFSAKTSLDCLRCILDLYGKPSGFPRDPRGQDTEPHQGLWDSPS